MIFDKCLALYKFIQHRKKFAVQFFFMYFFFPKQETNISLDFSSIICLQRIAETLDAEIKRWAAGKEGNLRALLSTLQYVSYLAAC